MRPPPPRSTLFPYTTLFRSAMDDGRRRYALIGTGNRGTTMWGQDLLEGWRRDVDLVAICDTNPLRAERADRKSTRLNSSHVRISYAVFCLKKKKKDSDHPPP